MKTQLQHQLGGNTLQEWGKVLQEAVCALNQRLIYSTISHSSWNQGVAMRMATAAITSSDPLLKFLFLVLRSYALLAWRSWFQGEILLPGNAMMIPLSWKLTLPPRHFGLLKLLNQQAEKGVTFLFFFCFI